MLPSLTGATDAFAITPSDGTQMATHVRAIYVGGDGDIVVKMPSGDVTFTGVLAGSLIPVQTSWVKATGTTATSMIGLI